MDEHDKIKYNNEVLNRFGKTPEDILDVYRILEDWIQKQPHLKHIPLEKYTLAKVGNSLINAKFNVEKVKKIVDTFYSLRNAIPEVFNDWDVFSEDIQHISKVLGVVYLPYLTPEMNQVLVFRILDPDTNKLDLWQCLKEIIFFLEMHFRKEYSTGMQVVFDMSTVKIGHISKFTATFVQSAHNVFAHMFVLRIFGIHMLYPNPMLVHLLKLIKVTMKPKVFSRIHLHDNLESLYKFVPKKILPKEFDGTQSSYQELFDGELEELRKMRDIYLDDAKYKSVESKRTDKSTGLDIFDSMHGTFRKLTID